MNKTLREQIQQLKRETPHGTSMHYLTGTAEGVRIAFEDVLTRQRRMLEVMEQVLDLVETKNVQDVINSR